VGTVALLSEVEERPVRIMNRLWLKIVVSVVLCLAVAGAAYILWPVKRSTLVSQQTAQEQLQGANKPEPATETAPASEPRARRTAALDRIKQQRAALCAKPTQPGSHRGLSGGLMDMSQVSRVGSSTAS